MTTRRTIVKNIKPGTIVFADFGSNDLMSPTGMSHLGSYLVRIDSIGRCGRSVSKLSKRSFKGIEIRLLGTVVGVDSSYPEDIEMAAGFGAVIFDLLIGTDAITVSL